MSKHNLELLGEAARLLSPLWANWSSSEEAQQRFSSRTKRPRRSVPPTQQFEIRAHRWRTDLGKQRVGRATRLMECQSAIRTAYRVDTPYSDCGSKAGDDARRIQTGTSAHRACSVNLARPVTGLAAANDRRPRRANKTRVFFRGVYLGR